jgi:ABC-2 type transport system ATP-binding protein
MTGEDIRRNLAQAVIAAGWGLLELRQLRMSLEEVFLHLTTNESNAETPDIPEDEEREIPTSNTKKSLDEVVHE